MPRFQAHAPADSPLARDAQPGAQVMVDVGDGEVSPAKLIDVETTDDGVTVTYEASQVAMAMTVDNERVELD